MIVLRDERRRVVIELRRGEVSPFAGRIQLNWVVAQREIATDWLRYYLAWQTSTTSAPSAPKQSSASTFAPPNVSSAEGYYTSSYGSSKYYYPTSCTAWTALSSSYLVSFSSLEALLAKYPNRTLSPQCE